MADWQLELFHCLVETTSGPQRRTLGGWVREPFAIDPRFYFDERLEAMQKGWVITHLPTGFIVRGVRGGLEQAKLVCDCLLDGDDWDFVDVAVAQARGPRVKALMEQFPSICAPSQFESALWLDRDGE